MLSIKEKKLGPRPNSHKEMQKNTKYMSTQISVGWMVLAQKTPCSYQKDLLHCQCFGWWSK